MIIRNKKTGKVNNVKEVIVKFHGSFLDIINRNTAYFFYHNTDPKVIMLELLGKDGNIVEKKFNMTSVDNFHGLLADIRFDLLGHQGYTVTKLRTFLKPKKLIHDEQEFLTFGVIQEPISYTVIFLNL